MIIKRLNALYRNSGFFLFFLRLPLRTFKTILNKLSTAYYSCICCSFGKFVVIEYGVHIENPKQVKIGNNVYIARGTKIISENSTGVLTVNDDVHIGNNCHIDHTGNVSIGRKTLISEDVYIYSHSHGVDPRSSPVAMDKKICDECWLGVRSMVLEGATYVSESTILAGSAVLTKDVKNPNCIYAGVPAKEIKQYDC